MSDAGPSTEVALAPRPSRALWVTLTLGLVLIVIAIRFAINFSHVYPPGTDAAYYPLQARHWLTHGRLMYDDLPLVFWIDAGLGRVLMAAGWETDAAVLVASRVMDCSLPPWIAACVMALGYQWSGGRRAAIAGCGAAAITTVLWWPAMIMLSEFEKNSLGLVWMAAAVWACVLAMRDGGWRRWLALAGILALAALTHIGSFAATALTIGLALLFRLATPLRAARLRVWLNWLVTIAAVGASLLLLLAAFDSTRAVALVNTPVTMFRNVGWGGRQGMVVVLLIVAIGVAAMGLRQVWRERGQGLEADAAIVIAASIVAIVLAVPKNAEYLGRLALMAGVPIAIVFTYVMARRGAAGRSPVLGFLALAGALAVAAMGISHARPLGPGASVVQAEGGDELRRVRGQIADPDATLVIATHGLEWWAGYFLHTPVRTISIERQPDGSLRVGPIPVDARTRYRRVLYLRQLPASSPRQPVTPPPSTAEGSLARIYAGTAFELYELNPSRSDAGTPK